MKNRAEDLWTIEQLSERVAQALADGYDGVPSGRVRDVPDLRTIRYYTTLGLLDRPVALRGRTALYSRRHLLQLVAIKRLQAKGLSLAEVQEQVIGLPNAALARIAQTQVPGLVRAVSAPPPDSRAESFWRASPDAARPGDRCISVPASAASDRDPGSRNEAIPLAAGLGIWLNSRRELNEDDLRVIRMAAAPLIEILRLRGLISIGPDQQGDSP
jgi:hypothetical protein